ncbi:MAG: hypothetical protein ACR2PT_12160 [Endozoicomonas sp.]
MKFLVKKIGVLTAAVAFSASILAADLSKKDAEDFFWKLVESVRNESADYFNFFASDAKITYELPESYQMKSGEISLKDLKQYQEETWSYTDNYSFDLEKPKVVTKGGKATINTTFYERYTTQGSTTTNESIQKYVLGRQGGNIKVLEFKSIVHDLTKQQYEEKKKTKAMKK